jgi:hypothetical protein
MKKNFCIYKKTFAFTKKTFAQNNYNIYEFILVNNVTYFIHSILAHYIDV